MNGYRDLLVWNKAKHFAVNIYKITDASLIKKDFGLTDQIRRASVSIPSNIAEGDERESDKEGIRFFNIAKASLAEVRTQLEISVEIGLISENDFKSLDDQADELARMLTGLIKSRKQRLTPST